MTIAAPADEPRHRRSACGVRGGRYAAADVLAAAATPGLLLSLAGGSTVAMLIVARVRQHCPRVTCGAAPHCAPLLQAWRLWRWVSQASRTPAGVRRSGWPTSFHPRGRSATYSVRGVVDDLPQATPEGVRFAFAVEQSIRRAPSFRNGSRSRGSRRAIAIRFLRRCGATRVAACRSCRRTLATDRAVETAARQRQSGRIRSRGVAARTQPACDRLCPRFAGPTSGWTRSRAASAITSSAPASGFGCASRVHCRLRRTRA